MSYPDSIVISGAGASWANREVPFDSLYEDRPDYLIENASIYVDVYWVGSFWVLAAVDKVADIEAYYHSYDDVASPDLCSIWVVVEGYEYPPAPTVTAAGGSAQNLTLSCAAGSYSLAGVACTLTYTPAAQNLTLSCGAGSLALTGSACTLSVKRNYTLACNAGSYALAGVACTLTALHNYVLAAESPAYPDIVVSGAGTSAANGTYSFLVMLESKPVYTKGDGYNIWWDSSYYYWTIYHSSIGEYYTSTEDVATPDLVTTWTIGAEGSAPVPTVTAPALYNLTGSACTLTYTKATQAPVLTCDAGSYSLTGSDVTLTYTPATDDYTLVCEAGSYSLTGTDISFVITRVYTLACESGSYTLTGTDVSFGNTIAYSLACNSGSYLLTGAPVSLTSARSLACNSGAYVLTGLEADLFKGLVMPCGNGSYVLTGSPATINSARTFALGMGSYVLVGTDVGLYILTITPDCRTYFIDAENRTWLINSEDRTMEVRCH